MAPPWLAKTRSSARAIGLDLPVSSWSALETEDRNLRSSDFGRKGGRYVAGRHRDFLGAVHRVSDHPAADRAADLLAPQLLAGRRVKCIEIAAHVAKEHETPRGRRHGAHDRII